MYAVRSRATGVTDPERFAAHQEAETYRGLTGLNDSFDDELDLEIIEVRE